MAWVNSSKTIPVAEPGLVALANEAPAVQRMRILMFLQHASYVVAAVGSISL